MTIKEVQDKYHYRFPGPRGIECWDGWAGLIDRFLTELATLPHNEDVSFFSIKEKFGIIRIDENEAISGELRDLYLPLVSKYERLSRVTCEVCGNVGIHTRTGRGWMKVLCEEHQKEKT